MLFRSSLSINNQQVNAQEIVEPQVVSAGESSYYLKADGTLWAWGQNYSGEIGDGTTMNRSSPVQVMNNVISFVSANATTFAIKMDGTLWAWGNNDSYQVGDGTLGIRAIPVQILTDVKKVFTDGASSYAIKSDGSLWGWGKG